MASASRNSGNFNCKYRGYMGVCVNSFCSIPILIPKGLVASSRQSDASLNTWIRSNHSSALKLPNGFYIPFNQLVPSLGPLPLLYIWLVQILTWLTPSHHSVLLKHHYLKKLPLLSCLRHWPLTLTYFSLVILS